MKKNLKGILSLTLCMLIMLTTFISPSLVQAKTSSKPKVSASLVNDPNVINLAKKYQTTPQAIDNNTVFLPLSAENNIKYIADSKHITYSQAELLVKDQNSKVIKTPIKSLKNPGTVINYSSVPGAAYEDVTGIILKRFNVVSGVSTTCTVIAAINVLVRIYWQYANTREFLAVYDTGITMAESSIWTWVTNTKSSVIMSNGFLNLNASGTISGTITASLTATYKVAGFSIGTNYYVNKFQTISYVFDPDYIGGMLY